MWHIWTCLVFSLLLLFPDAVVNEDFSLDSAWKVVGQKRWQKKEWQKICAHRVTCKRHNLPAPSYCPARLPRRQPVCAMTICAAAQRFCSVYAHAETLRHGRAAALAWATALRSPQAVSSGDTGVKPAAAPTWWSQSVRRRRVTDWRSHGSALSSGPPHLTPFHAFPRSGGARTLSQGWPEWDHRSRRGGAHAYRC